MIRLSKICLVGLSFVLNSCAQDTIDVRVKLVYGSEADGDAVTSPARIFIEDAPTTARVMYRYDKLELGSWVVVPNAAFPTFIAEGDAKLTLWHKASGPGLRFDRTGFVDISSIPYRRKGFQMAIEFILEVSGIPNTKNQYYIVAFACYSGPANDVLSEAKFREDMARGLRIYAGRSCGVCPGSEGEQDNPAFTLENVTTNLPEACE